MYRASLYIFQEWQKDIFQEQDTKGQFQSYGFDILHYRCDTQRMYFFYQYTIHLYFTKLFLIESKHQKNNIGYALVICFTKGNKQWTLFLKDCILFCDLNICTNQ